MDRTDEHSASLCEVYRLIGRNVVLFQQVETILKLILKNGRWEGTVSEIKEHAKKEDKRTLGQLIDPLVESHLAPDDAPDSPIQSTSEIAFSAQATFAYTAEERDEFRRELEEVVAERNQLIHTLLNRYRLSSADDCSLLTQDLERQFSKVKPVRDHLKALVEAMSEAQRGLLEGIRQYYSSKEGKK